MFVHLHGHSTYSMLEGIWSIKEIIARIQELGMNTVALTDYFGLYGIVDFFRTASDNEVKPIFGLEIHYVDKIQWYIPDESDGTIVLLAESMLGYSNLLKLMSFAFDNLIDEKPTIDKAKLEELQEGIFCLIGGTLSWYGKKVSQWISEAELNEYLYNFLHIFWKKHLVMEVVAQDYSDEPSYQKINEWVLEFAQKEWLIAVATSNFHYLRKEDKEAYELALAIKDGYKIFDEQRRHIKWHYHIYSEQEVRQTLTNNWIDATIVDELINNTWLIADQCEVKLELYQSLFPKYENPDYITSLYQQYGDELVDKM